MKNKLFVKTIVGTAIFGAIGGAAVLGASNTNNANQTGISAEQALEIAFEQTEGIVQQVELSFEDDENYYEIEIDSKTNEVELIIDATTGEIVEQQMEDNLEDADDDSAVDHDDFNDPADVTQFEEYKTITNNVAIENLDFQLATDNQGNRVMFLVDEKGNKQFKTIFVKYDNHLKIIDLNNDGLIYNGNI